MSLAAATALSSCSLLLPAAWLGLASATVRAVTRLGGAWLSRDQLQQLNTALEVDCRVSRQLAAWPLLPTISANNKVSSTDLIIQGSRSINSH